MTEYHKIDSIYKRDTKGKFILGDWAKPEFEYLADKPWRWTEKIDGTNIRLIWNGLSLKFGGRTDNAQLPNKLIANLTDHFHGQFVPGAEMFDGIFGSSPAVIYGEGYGAGIQKGGGNYFSDNQWFIVFDIKIGNWYLERENVEDIAKKLGLDVVRQYASTTLQGMIDFVSDGMIVESAFNLPDRKPEGYVGTPTVPLFNRKVERIITKIKYKDFE